MERHSDCEPRVTGAMHGSSDHQGNEANDADEHMWLNKILNETNDLIVDKVDLKRIGETVDTEFWRKKTDI